MRHHAPRAVRGNTYAQKQRETHSERHIHLRYLFRDGFGASRFRLSTNEVRACSTNHQGERTDARAHHLNTATSATRRDTTANGDDAIRRERNTAKRNTLARRGRPRRNTTTSATPAGRTQRGRRKQTGARRTHATPRRPPPARNRAPLVAISQSGQARVSTRLAVSTLCLHSCDRCDDLFTTISDTDVQVKEL